MTTMTRGAAPSGLLALHRPARRAWGLNEMFLTRIGAPLLGAIVAATAACSNTAPTAPTDASRVTLQLGQTVTVGPERTALTFERVALDRRCPYNASCIDNGYALLQFRIGSSREPNALRTLRAAGETDYLHVPGAALTPTDLTPAPWAPFDWPESEYRVTLEVIAD
jgi:hypothetical protein